MHAFVGFADVAGTSVVVCPLAGRSTATAAVILELFLPWTKKAASVDSVD